MKENTKKANISYFTETPKCSVFIFILHWNKIECF